MYGRPAMMDGWPAGCDGWMATIHDGWMETTKKKRWAHQGTRLWDPGAPLFVVECCCFLIIIRRALAQGVSDHGHFVQLI